jgi:peptidoglycan/xylan/chitin deacetylase (PgdA/CDA1 family)
VAKLVFTFDDGIRTHYDLVRPLLKEHGLTGTFFVPGDAARCCWNKPLRRDHKEGPLSWDEIRELHADGFEVGNHTLTHPNMLHVGHTARRREVQELDDALVSHGIPASSTFCYPGYSTSDAVCKVVRDLGFKFARTGHGLHGCRSFIKFAGTLLSEDRKPLVYYVPAVSDPMSVNSTGILEDDYTVDHFIHDIEGTPEGAVAVFTAHGFAYSPRWKNFKEMVKYVVDNGHETINFRDMPVAQSSHL